MTGKINRKGFSVLSLETHNQLFSDVMANGKKYGIPRFQRDYSWQLEQWDELWKDIESMRESRIQHFMGYLVFQAEDSKTFTVIDGQQRLTTISILVLAALKKLDDFITNGIEEDDNRERMESYKRTYIGVFDPVTLRTDPKLVLNRHNDSHFRAIVRTYNITMQRNITATNRNINKAFRFFENKFLSYKSGAEVAQILTDVADGLLFTTITVQDDLNAYTVFETLNARGMHLSTPDLLKNYLLSVMASSDAYLEHHFLDFEEQWAGILEQLGETEFTNFLRSYRGIQKKLVSKKDLFRTLKTDVRLPENVLLYLEDLKKYAPVYAALQDHNDNFWAEDSGRYTEVRPHLEALRIFNIKTPLSLLMAGYDKFSPQDFISLVKYIVAVSIRYNVICTQPSKDQEQIYNDIAYKVANENINLYDLTNMLRPVYPDNNSFGSAFASTTLPSRQSSKKIQFLLHKIEQQLSNEEPPTTLTIEHVLPYSPDDAWQEYFGRESVEQAIHMLGNMALLPSNQNMGQENFARKREVLQASQCCINQHIAEYPKWDMDNLKGHQDWLAGKAKTIWKISQLEQPNKQNNKK